MIEFITIAVLLAGFWVAWGIGASDSANCIGTAVGGGILSYRRAVVILIIFVFIGAILEGWKNMRTVGGGIVIGTGGTNPLFDFPQATIAALIATGAWLITCTTLGLPISTTQSMVGAIVGAGLLLGYTREDVLTGVQLGNLSPIFISWVLNPLFAALLAFTLLKASTPALRRIKNIVLLNRILTILVVAAIASSAYALGANDVGASTGAVFASLGGGGVDFGLMRFIALFGVIALVLGTLTYSRRVMHTVGTGITRLDALTASAAQFGAAITVWSFVQFGMPVSPTQAIVGAVIGVGLVKGMTTVNWRKLSHIGVAWVLSPAFTCALSFALGWLFLGL